MCQSRFDIRWLAVAVICTAALLTLTHLPQETIPSALRKSGLDKIEHALAYGIVTSLFLMALRTLPNVFSLVCLLLAIAAIAALDELTQGFVNRTPSIADFIANMLGMLVAVFVCTLWICHLRRFRS